jgi:hypothetical protein
VNFCVSCTEKKKVFVVGLLIIFFATISLEFSAKIFLATFARETLINDWNIPWVNFDKNMTHPLEYP